jgi:hypothetical protein
MTNYFRKDTEPVPGSPETSLSNETGPIELDSANVERAQVDRAQVESAEVERIEVVPISERAVPGPDRRPLIVPPASEPWARPAGGAVGVAPTRAVEQERIALFVPNESNELRARWDRIQVDFVDQPRKAVEDADALVSATMSRLAEIFSAERQKLERQWEKNENISTEDLRLTLQRYRSFFGRLLSI